MIRNKSALGLFNFLKQYTEDAKKGILNKWWNEKLGRRSDRVSVEVKEQKLTTVYDLVNFIGENFNDLSEQEINSILDSAGRSPYILNRKRVYLWEVDEEKSKETVETKEDVLPDATVEENEEPVEEEKEDKPEEDSPDFDFAKTIEDRKELKDYAKSFGFKLDSRKSLSDMMKSFQGKYHASKNK